MSATPFPGLNTLRPLDFFLLCYAVLMIVLIGQWRMTGARFGVALQAVRQNEGRVAALGLSPYRIRLAAFVISGMVTGLAGALYADLNRFVSPTMMSWHLSGEIMVFIILGGVARLFGPVVGACLFVLFEHAVRQLHRPLAVLPGCRAAGVVLFARGGFIGLMRGGRGMTEPVLSLSGLSKSFGALKVTDGVDLDLRPGEIHALIGPNGAGKSSLIKLVAGELAADAGAIRFAGREISDLDQVARARLGLTRTFQVSSLIPEFSARGNVMLAAQARRRSVFGFSARSPAIPI
jgi:hypothetical protein